MTGCYDMNGGLIFNEEGEGQALVGVSALEYMGGEETRILSWQLDFIFPDIDLNYDNNLEIVTEDYQDYAVVTFERNEKIDLSESEYFSFEERADGSFEFIAEIPKILDDVSSESVDETVLSFFIEMPKDIEMANSTNVDGNLVQWNIIKEDLTTETTLRAFTEQFKIKKEIEYNY